MDVVHAFGKVYAETLKSPDLLQRIQRVKDALYRRSYIEAFEDEDNLRAYVVRWSPSRALAYAHIFRKYKSISEQLGPNTKVLCIGGGAGAEIAALASQSSQVTVIDIGDWRPVVLPLIHELKLNATVIHGDALIYPIDWSQYDLITCLFTSNELFVESKAGAVKFFDNMAAARHGTIMVIVESAGSYSEIMVGSKKFPVHFLIHHRLDPAWELVESVDSEWYRLPEDIHLHYPLELQNMRYFLRVYRRR